jgi:hypothetical protein
MDPFLLVILVIGALCLAQHFAPSGAKRRFEASIPLGSALWVQVGGRKGDLYNILWILVFGFATLNILSLGARRFEPNKNRLNFGEFMAILVVFISVSMLGWEMLNLFHIFPIKLRPH